MSEEKKAPKKRTRKKKVVQRDWKVIVGEVIGVTLPKPHNINGYRGTKTGVLLRKNHSRIMKTELTDQEKKAIANLYL